MAYEHPLFQRRRERLAKRGDILEANLTKQPGPPSYLYRPRELLCERRDVPKVLGALDQRKLKPLFEPEDRRREGFDILRLKLETPPRRLSVRQLVRGLRADGLNVAPNHVFPGAPAYQGCPEGDPISPTDPKKFRFPPRVVDGPVVAVVDTSYTWNVYSGLDARIDSGASAGTAGTNEDLDADGDGIRDDCAGHALFILGLIAQACPVANFVLEPILDSDGYAEEWELASAIMNQADVDVINLSLAGPATLNLPPIALVNAVNFVRDRGKAVVVTAVGNNGAPAAPGPGWFYPAYLERAQSVPPSQRIIVAVGATNADGTRALYSNYPADEWVPGDARSTFFKANGNPVLAPYNGEADWRGTSFATARVSATVACKIQNGVSAREAVSALVANTSLTPELGPSPPLPA